MRKYHNKSVNINSRQTQPVWRNLALWERKLLWGNSIRWAPLIANTVIWLPFTDKKYSDFSKNLYYNKTIPLQRVTQFTFSSFIFDYWVIYLSSTTKQNCRLAKIIFLGQICSLRRQLFVFFRGIIVPILVRMICYCV